MSTYYQYQDVSVMIAHSLMEREGWKVYGYHADESDPMTDYYDPAYWGGLAEKNGYIFVFNHSSSSEEKEIRKYNSETAGTNHKITEQINKLKELTTERGATEGEQQQAEKMIEKLQAKQNKQNAENPMYIVEGYTPAHQANPPRCNWHIEKDGVIIAKGAGLLKYSSVYFYYTLSNYKERRAKYKKDVEKWTKELARDYYYSGYYSTQEEADKQAAYSAENMKKEMALCDDFDRFINKIDSTCGGMIGEGEIVTYKKIKVTKYKKEVKAVETTSGEIKEGQCFILKSSFTYGCYKGLVYRIHETEYKGKKTYHAYKLNGKLTKECTGRASRNNYWHIGSADDERFLKWIDKGLISWCELQEVQTPYEVEKVVKETSNTQKTTTKNAKTTEADSTETDINNLTFTVSEDTDTRDNSKIYLVKVVEKLSKSDYIKVNQYIKSLGGYYSKFKHAFLFRDDPREKLNTTRTQEAENDTETTEEAPTEEIKTTPDYIITEDKHTKTGAAIWIVTFENQLSKADFAEIRKKFATLKGYYSSFKKGFIFNYNPEEILKAA